MISTFKSVIKAFFVFLPLALAACAHDDNYVEHDSYDTSKVFDDIANNAQGGGN
jgi:hypothetical protein